MSVLLWACAGGSASQGSQVVTAGEGTAGDAAGAPHSAADLGAGGTEKSHAAPKTASAIKAKTTFSAPGQTCTPLDGSEPKIVTGESSASDAADTGRALIFDVAGIAVELPACTPEADVRVITVSWDTKDRPNAARIHPKFTRHAATLRMDQAITARNDAPLLVRLQSKRELAKPAEKLVLAVESSGECNEQNKRDKLDDGGCAHWQLFDATFDGQRNEMVARVPATGGYRLQFGWVPAK